MSDYVLTNKDRRDLYYGLIEILTIVAPHIAAETLYDIWDAHPVLKDYKRPSLTTVQAMVNQLRYERAKNRSQKAPGRQTDRL